MENRPERGNLKIRKPSPEIRTTFIGTVLFALAVHGMGLFNKLSFHDDILALFGTGTTIPSGRWMLHVAGWLETLIFGDGHFSLPVMNGLFSIGCVAVSACMLVNLLKIRGKAQCLGLGCLMVAFPTVTGLFGYMFTMPYYMLAMTMMTACACIICSARRRWMRIPAVILGGCSVGIYQAFLPMLLSILLLYDLSVLAEGKEPAGAFLKRAGVQLLCVLGTVAFYFAANRFFLAKFGMEMNGYMGNDRIGSTSAAVYLERAGRAYREFFLPARNVYYDMYPMHVHYMYLLMIAADVLLAVRLICVTGKRSRGKAALLALLFALFPLGCNFIFVMSETVHGLMTYGQVAQFALFVWLTDRLELRPPRADRLLALAVSLVLGLTGIMYARFANQCYLKVTFQQQQAVSYYTTLVSRIKSTEGYRDDLPVAFLGGEHIADRTLANIDELDFIHLDSYGETSESYINSYSWTVFMERWCGYGPEYHDGSGLRDLPEVRDMPHYPDDGSIRIVQDVIVVNF